MLFLLPMLMMLKNNPTTVWWQLKTPAWQRLLSAYQLSVPFCAFGNVFKKKWIILKFETFSLCVKLFACSCRASQFITRSANGCFQWTSPINQSYHPPTTTLNYSIQRSSFFSKLEDAHWFWLWTRCAFSSAVTTLYWYKYYVYFVDCL